MIPLWLNPVAYRLPSESLVRIISKMPPAAAPVIKTNQIILAAHRKPLIYKGFFANFFSLFLAKALDNSLTFW